MARNLIFVTIALVSVVMAGPGEGDKKGPPGGEHKRGGPGGPQHFLPPFFRNVSEEGKKEIGAVFKNQNLTIAQAETQIAALAEKYGVAAAYKEHKEKEAAKHAEIKKNATAVIGNLSAVAAKLSAIHEKKDQTRKAQREAIQALRKESGVAVDAIEFIGRKLAGFGGPAGHHGGHKGGPGGFGKFGGKHGEKKDGDKVEKKTEKTASA